MTTTTRYSPDWLSGYASHIYDWRHQYSDTPNPKKKQYTRKLGIVEGLFDADGTLFEGRADLNVDLSVQFSISPTTMTTASAVREHISNAWAVLRQFHVLMSARVETRRDHDYEPTFLFEQASSEEDLFGSAAKDHITFLADHYETVDATDFYRHLMNASRAIDSTKALARLFVHPYKYTPDRPFTVNFVFVLAHQISDGLTLFRWVKSFIGLLNLSNSELKHRASLLVSESAISRLPPAQEALYHPIKGSKARQRWFWAIARVLRHTKRPPPMGFSNPLQLQTPPSGGARRYPPKYDKVLDYSRIPPLNNYAVQPTLSRTATARLTALCREARISIGSGLFTLIALVMMLFEERLHPDIDPTSRLPFIGSFPVNPRPFLAGVPTTGAENSLMLAFSDAGVILPFLPSNLPFDSRFRLLGKQAHRQLKQFQKRRRQLQSPQEELRQLGINSPTNMLLPQMYLATLERLESRREPAARRGYDFQGAYPAASATAAGFGGTTCGISSVGDRAPLLGLLLPRAVGDDVSSSSSSSCSSSSSSSSSRFSSSSITEKDQLLKATFININSAVRARDGEFLCGAVGDSVDGKTYFMISVDGCAIDMQKAEEFKRVIEGILLDVDTVGSGAEVESDKEKRKGRGKEKARL